MSDEKHQKGSESILGLSTNELAGLSPEDLNNNPVAIKMLLHYYRQLVDDNSSLKNNNNTLETYVSAYERHKNSAAVGAILLAVSNISVGFGVNLLTDGTTWPGVSSLIAGLSMVAAGIYFSFKKA